MRLPLLRFGLFLTVMIAAPWLHAQREKLPEEDLEIVEQKWPDAKKTTTGIRYIVLREGHGAIPVPGNRVAVIYTGRLLDGTVFDQSLDPDRPFIFRMGRQVVIQGWDYILEQMRVGEKRLVIVPPELAYGTHGMPPRIPRNATLVFTMELLEIKPD
jgi:FKBP-type peptidyl-prolyl cis-trans isomerase